LRAGNGIFDKPAVGGAFFIRHGKAVVAVPRGARIGGEEDLKRFAGLTRGIVLDADDDLIIDRRVKRKRRT